MEIQGIGSRRRHVTDGRYSFGAQHSILYDRQQMLRSVERQPQLFGAIPGAYINGQVVGTGDSPPTWSPDMASNPDFPYGIEEYAEDIHRWVAATRMTRERRGNFLP